MRAAILIATAMLSLSCTAVQQQKAQPPATDDLHFKNLQVLPPNISREELIATMRRFTQALGVGCEYCHVGVQPDLDFPSDAKREKEAARLMMRMTQSINQDFVRRLPEAYTVVSCWTCHRGEVQPAVVPSLPTGQ